MNLSQITAFQAVMTSASLSDAARKLGRTQPAVSAAIKTLEDQLGLQLFRREGRKMVPVPEARYLLTEASAILNQLSRVRQTMKSLTDGQSGSLNVAAMLGPVTMLFPRFIANQFDKNTDIMVSLLARSSAQIAELARAQSIDFGFADAPEMLEPEPLYRTEQISADCFVAAPCDNPIADLEEVALSDLNGQPMGSLQASHPHQREVLQAFEARKLTFSLTVESQTFLPILQFVAAGQCCLIIDPLTLAHVRSSAASMEGVVFRPLAEKFRYRYAIFEPNYRPVSVLAEQLKVAWKAEVFRLLVEVGAEPALDMPQNISDTAS